jgi:Protein of unknown function (DUF3551)
MRHYGLAIATCTVLTVCGSSPSHALYGNAPWCAVQSIGPGDLSEACIYPDFESCRSQVIAGNRGFCNTNPYLAGQPVTAGPTRKPHRKRARR